MTCTLCPNAALIAVAHRGTMLAVPTTPGRRCWMIGCRPNGCPLSLVPWPSGDPSLRKLPWSSSTTECRSVRCVGDVVATIDRTVCGGNETWRQSILIMKSDRKGRPWKPANESEVFKRNHLGLVMPQILMTEPANRCGLSIPANWNSLRMLLPPAGCYRRLRLAYSSVAASLGLWMYSMQLPLSAAAASATSVLPMVLGAQMSL